MGWQQQVITAPVVIIQSGAAGSGLFIYSGTPASGNPPVLAAVAPGVTKDPFGNAVLAVLNIGNFSAAHTGFDAAGIEYLSDSTGTVKIIIDPARGMFFYSGTAAFGNPPQLSLVLPGVTTDTLGNAIGASKILVQGNVITESGGIFRTAATAPLIQLDGPHNAYLQYNGASVLSETIAPAATTDGLGNAVQGGITAYLSQTFFANLKSGLLTFADTVNAAFAGGQIGLTTITTSDDALAMQSPLSLSTDIQASLRLQRAATPGPAHVLIGNADLRLPDTSPAAPGSGIALHSASGHGKSLSSADGNDYGAERLSLFSSTTHLFNSTSAFTVPGLSAPVGIGTYRIDGIVYGVQGPTAAGQNVQIFGPAISFGRTYIESNADANTSVTDSNISGALPHIHTTPAWGAGVNFYVRFKGIYTFTAAGTLTVQGASNSAANTWTSQTACLCDLMPV